MGARPDSRNFEYRIIWCYSVAPSETGPIRQEGKVRLKPEKKKKQREN